MPEQHFRCESCGDCFMVRADDELQDMGCPNCGEKDRVQAVEQIHALMLRAVRDT
jgi:predicted  nucleic acid-binding Zn-ribbon protein